MSKILAICLVVSVPFKERIFRTCFSANFAKGLSEPFFPSNLPLLAASFILSELEPRNRCASLTQIGLSQV